MTIIHTSTTASLAVMIRMSAQETIPGHAFSKACLNSSITLYDLRESIFDRPSFSPSMFGVSSSNNEASQPYHPKNNNKQTKIISSSPPNGSNTKC